MRTVLELPPDRFPQGSSLPARPLDPARKHFDTARIDYREFMRALLATTKFAHLPAEAREQASFESDMTEEIYRRVDRFHDALIPWISRVCDLNHATVLEIGSGTGSSTLAFAPYVKHIHCYEIESSTTEIAKARLGFFGISNVTFAETLFNNDCSFVKEGGKADLILLVAVLEHVHFHEFQTILKDAYDALKPGGVILIAETPNRLSMNDYHTSWIPFFQWLPPEVADRYAHYAPRTQFKYEMDAFAARNEIGTSSHREHVVRWGRGVSYHDFELVFGPGVHDMVVLNGWEPEVRTLAPIFADDHFLVAMSESLGIIIASNAFARSWLYFALQKPIY